MTYGYEDIESKWNVEEKRRKSRPISSWRLELSNYPKIKIRSLIKLRPFIWNTFTWTQTFSILNPSAGRIFFMLEFSMSSCRHSAVNQYWIQLSHAWLIRFTVHCGTIFLSTSVQLSFYYWNWIHWFYYSMTQVVGGASQWTTNLNKFKIAAIVTMIKCGNVICLEVFCSLYRWFCSSFSTMAKEISARIVYRLRTTL